VTNFKNGLERFSVSHKSQCVYVVCWAGTGNRSYEFSWLSDRCFKHEL